MNPLKDLSQFQSKFYDFEFCNDFKIIVCYHYYGRHGKSSFKIICHIENTELKTVKNAVSRIKREISEAKKQYEPMHGCTNYLPSI